ncbi:MAG: hypothetical protein AAGJ34_05375 [Pseudomonadota bacterium]
MIFLAAGVFGVLLGWFLAFRKGKNAYDQAHSAVVMGLIFTILSVIIVVAAGWIAFYNA